MASVFSRTTRGLVFWGLLLPTVVFAQVANSVLLTVTALAFSVVGFGRGTL